MERAARNNHCRSLSLEEPQLPVELETHTETVVVYNQSWDSSCQRCLSLQTLVYSYCSTQRREANEEECAPCGRPGCWEDCRGVWLGFGMAPFVLECEQDSAARQRQS